MPKIGKAIVANTGMRYDFTLTVGGTAYHFDKKTGSKEVASVYKFVKDTIGWYLIVYASGTINFVEISHKIDFCIVGGGGGGGGASQYYASTWGGDGGGGQVINSNEYNGKPEWANGLMLNPASPYSIVVGGGGARGSRSGAGWGGGGGSGGATSFNGVQTDNAAGGGGAHETSGGDGNNRPLVYVFNDSARIALSVSGENRYVRGSGGRGADPATDNASAGIAGVFVIRSTPKV